MKTVRNFARFLDSLPVETQEYFLEFEARGLGRLKQWESLEALLTCFEYLQRKLDRFGIEALIADFDPLVDSDLSVVQDALKLSGPALRRDPSQLYTQLFGRMRYGVRPKVDRLLRNPPASPWIRDENGVLLPALGAVVQNISNDAQSSIALSHDGKFAISITNIENIQHVVRMWDLDTGEAQPFAFTSSEAIRDIFTTIDDRKMVLLSEHGALTVINVSFGVVEMSRDFRQATIIRIMDNGQRILAACGNGDIEIWDLVSGKLVVRPGRHRKVVSLVASPSGETIVSGSEDGTLAIWKGRGWSSNATFLAHEGAIVALAISESGRWLVSASRDGAVRGWDAADGTPRFAAHGFECSGDSCRSETLLLKERPGSLFVFSTGPDYTVKAWKWSAGNEGSAGLVTIPAFSIFSGHQDRITAIAMNPDGERLISSSDDGTLKEWSLTTGKLIHTFRGHTDKVYAVRITPSGDRAVSAARDNTVKVWTLTRGGGTVVDQGAPITDLAIANAGHRVISISLDESVCVWSLFSHRRMFFLAEQPSGKTYRLNRYDYVQGVAITPDGAKGVSLSGNGDLFTWRIIGSGSVFPSTDRGMLHHFRKCFPFRWRRKWKWNVDFDLMPDGKAVLSSTVNGAVHLWDFETGTILQSFYQGESRLCTLSAFLGKCLDPLHWLFGLHLVGCLSNMAMLIGAIAVVFKYKWKGFMWLIAGGGILYCVEAFIKSYDPAARRKSVTLAGSESRVAVSSRGIVEMWDSATGRLISRVTEPSIRGAGKLAGFCMSPWGRWLVGISNSRTEDAKEWPLSKLKREHDPSCKIHVRDARSSSLCSELPLSGRVRLIRFNKNETHLVVLTFHELTVWRLADSLMVGQLEGEYSGNLDISLDGTCLAALSEPIPHELVVLDMSTGAIARFMPDVQFTCVKITEDGKTVVAGDESGRVCFLAVEGRGD